MKKKTLLIMFSLISMTLFFSSCDNENKPSKSNPVTITMWHNFGGDMQGTMNGLIDEFNVTVGQDNGITVDVKAIASSTELQKQLDLIIGQEPGAPLMPDVCTSYPKTAVLLKDKGLIANLDDYFSKSEISSYVDAFIDEGRFDDGLYVFPFAKSTEILYLNQTLMDEFSTSKADQEKLYSIEGLAELSEKYYAQTGKHFYSADSWFNFAEVGAVQLGGSIFNGSTLNLDSASYKKIFETAYSPMTNGGFATYDKYSSDLSKTGDIVCSTGSSAGILFYGDTITYPDNTQKKVTYNILPYSTFNGGEKTALQRGNGLIIAKSTKIKEYASSLFLKWLTETKQNLQFISSTGYLPVTKEAFEILPDELDNVSDIRIKKMLTAVLKMYDEYTFFTPPVFEEFDSLSKNYEKTFKQFMRDKVGKGISSEDAYKEFISTN